MLEANKKNKKVSAKKQNQNYILELKNTISEIKTSEDGLNRIIESTKAGISKLKDRTVESGWLEQ